VPQLGTEYGYDVDEEDTDQRIRDAIERLQRRLGSCSPTTRRSDPRLVRLVRGSLLVELSRVRPPNSHHPSLRGPGR
jgi:hypothetical protein